MSRLYLLLGISVGVIMATWFRDQTIPLRVSCYPALRPDNFLEHARHLPRAPSPSQGVTPSGATSRSHRKALPPPHRYIELMRQSKILPRPRFFTLYPESAQVVANPCWKLDLPDVIAAIFLHVSGPIPRLFLWCTRPLLPTERRPSR